MSYAALALVAFAAGLAVERWRSARTARLWPGPPVPPGEYVYIDEDWNVHRGQLVGSIGLGRVITSRPAHAPGLDPDAREVAQK